MTTYANKSTTTKNKLDVSETTHSRMSVFDIRWE